MIKKVILLHFIVMLCVFTKVSAQKTVADTFAQNSSAAPPETNAATPGSQNSINTPSLTSVLPPAPNAFELTRYSGLPVNLSTGAVSAKIPLGTVKMGRVQVPIQLSYNSGNGILLNQTASRTGMGWTLEAGGVISRTVNGNPDELSTWLKPPADVAAGTQAAYDYLNAAGENVANQDTQTDLFSFNFNGFSGQFYLDTNSTGYRNKAVQLETSNLRIETNFHNEFTGDWAFRITDPNGIKYYFGGTSATETSKTAPNGAGCGKNFNTPWATAWYLRSIQGYQDEYISFQYTPVSVEYYSGVSQTVIRTPAAGAGYGCTTPCPIRSENQVCLSKLTSQGVMLTGIRSSYAFVEFLYGSRTDMSGDYLLDGIRFNEGSSGFESEYYHLNYVTATNSAYYNPAIVDGTVLTKRPFLSGVSRTKIGMEPQSHAMKYYNINEMASRLSFAQDYWGYFNASNNSNLMPASNDPWIAVAFPSELANREPNGNVAHYGLLSKISYPTTGSDSLIYEPNTVYETRAILANATVTRSATGTGKNGEVNSTFPFTLGIDQNISLSMACNYSGTGIDDQLHQNLIVTIFDSGGYEIYNRLLKVGNTLNAVVSLSAGNFTLKLSAHGAAAAGTVTMNYKTSTYQTKNWQVGGVRLLRNISRPLDGPVVIKKYVYAALSSQTQSSGRLFNAANPNDYYSMLVDGNYCAADFSTTKCTYYIGYSNPVRSLNYFTGNSIYYSKVIELKGDQWANGGTEHQYVLASTGIDALLLRGTPIPGASMSNSGMPGGLETLSQTFFKTGGAEGNYAYKVVNKVATHYVSDTRRKQFADNYVVRRNWIATAPSTPPQAGNFDGFDVAKFTYETNWVYPDTVTTTSYDLAGNNPVSTVQYDVYNNPLNLLVSEKHTIGSDAIDQKMVYKYPHEMVAEGTTIPYQDMIESNKVSPVIEQLFYKGNSPNSILQQGLKTNYDNFGNGVFEPLNIQTKTTGNYETRINFYGYNINGGLLSQSKVGGMRTSYIWGYSNLFPVAEVKNALPTEIFYEGFEYGGTPATTYAHTGLRSNSAAFTVSFSPPAGKTYLISWFQLNGSQWDYKKEVYTGTKTFAAGTYVDDIAVYPDNAMATTAAFAPYLGQTGAVDPRGETTTYDYDGYKRLQNVRDLYGNILKNYSYGLYDYSGGGDGGISVNGYYNILQSQNFTRSCTVGSGSTYTYVVNAGSYSSSVSQADADNQALAEIAAYGQQKADAEGTCATGNVTVSYYNYTNLSSGAKSGGVSSLAVKNLVGTTLYTFTEAQLLSGQAIPPGTYNLVFTTYGPVANNTPSGLGWRYLDIYNGSAVANLTHTGVTSYTVNNATLTPAYPLSITITNLAL